MTNRASILVVEDDDSVRLTLRDYLKKIGHSVHVSSDGVGAIQQLLDHDVDVIVTDYRMNVLGGNYWIGFLERYCKDKIVIVDSAYLRQDLSVPFPVLEKPFDYASLAQLIDESLINEKEWSN